MKTSSKLFGGSHILHLTAFEDKKDILEHVYAHTRVTLPEKSKSMKLLGNNNIPVLSKGYYAFAVPDDLEILLYFTNKVFAVFKKV